MKLASSRDPVKRRSAAVTVETTSRPRHSTKPAPPSAMVRSAARRLAMSVGLKRGQWALACVAKGITSTTASAACSTIGRIEP